MGRRLVIVEDVVTTGGQMVLSAQDLRAEGAVVEHAVCVIDREGGGADVVGAEGIHLQALFTMRELEQFRVLRLAPVASSPCPTTQFPSRSRRRSTSNSPWSLATWWRTTSCVDIHQGTSGVTIAATTSRTTRTSRTAGTRNSACWSEGTGGANGGRRFPPTARRSSTVWGRRWHP